MFFSEIFGLILLGAIYSDTPVTQRMYALHYHLPSPNRGITSAELDRAKAVLL
jgi:hypothetical protein